MGIIRVSFLSKGKNLLVVPLLKQSDIVGWDHKQPYRVLVVCDSPGTYELFSKTTEDASAYWATAEDLELATQVLTTNTKILADSLDVNFAHHNAQANDCRRQRLESLHATLEQASKRVRVPTGDAGRVRALKMNRIHGIESVGQPIEVAHD